jgi:hypothetical protein
LEARAPTRQIVATGNYKHMILNTSTRRKGVLVMLDFSIQRNFILLETIKQLNIFIREKNEFYLFSIINRITIKQDKGIIRYETIPIQVIIRKYIKEINLDIIKINSY